MRRSAFALLLMLVATPARSQMTSIYTPYELDIQEAHLHKQWKRVDEFVAAHRKFISVRQDLLIDGYEKSMLTWHADVIRWLADWNASVAVLSGDSLSDKQVQADTIKKVKEQLIALQALAERVPVINDIGQAALQALNGLPTFPGDYIDIIETSNTDTYRDQIALYQSEIDAAKNQVVNIQKIFTSNLTTELDGLTRKMDDAVVIKIKILAVRFPELKDAIARTEKALAQLRVVDTVIASLQKDSEKIAAEITNEQVYTAKAHIEAWKAKAAQELQKISSNPALTPALVKYSRDMIQSISNSRDAQLDTQLQSRSELDIFSSYYDNQLNGGFGLVKQCLQQPRPKTIDCNLLRTIQGFEYEHIMQLTDEQAAYIEGVIAKVKRGIYRP